MLGVAVVDEEDELLGVVVLLGEVVVWVSVVDVVLELELDGAVLVLDGLVLLGLVLLGLVPAAAPWSLGVVPVLVLLGLVDDGVWLEVAGGFAD